MTLRQPNIDRLLQLGLSGMAEALEEQRDIADRPARLRRPPRHDDRARGRAPRSQELPRPSAPSPVAHVQDVDCRAGRGIARSTLTQLAAGDWIRQGHNLILGGPTGSGKTFVACARRPPGLPPAPVRPLSPRARAGRGAHPRSRQRQAPDGPPGSPCWSSTTGGCRASPPRVGATCWRSWRRATDASPSQIPALAQGDRRADDPDAVLDRIVHNAYRIELGPSASATSPRHSTAAAATEPRPEGRGPWAPAAPSRLQGRRCAAACCVESLPPRPAGRLHAQQASHTLGSGWRPAPRHHQGEGPTAKSGRDSALARARSTVKCCQNPGQIKSESRSGTGGQVNRNPHSILLTVKSQEPLRSAYPVVAYVWVAPAARLIAPGQGTYRRRRSCDAANRCVPQHLPALCTFFRRRPSRGTVLSSADQRNGVRADTPST